MIVCSAVGCGQQKQDAVNSTVESQKTEQKDNENQNIFASMFSLNEDDFAYTPQGLTYGMSKENVIKAENLQDYTENVVGNVIYADTLTDVSEEIKSLTLQKTYEFAEGYGLHKVGYTFRVSDTELDAFWQLLQEQSEQYMSTGIQDSKTEMIWGETISFDMAVGETDAWKTREVNRSFAKFVGDHVCDDGTKDHILSFEVGNGDSYWEGYKLFHDNFFSYAVSLDGETYTYDLPRKHLFQYGDEKSIIIKAQDTWYYNIEEEEDVISMSMSFRNMPDALKEFTFHKQFQFDSENGLTGVAYVLDVTDAEFDTLCELLAKQAQEYMPKAIEGNVEDIKTGKDVSWSAEDANGISSHVELTFSDGEDGGKTVMLELYIEK